MASQVFTSARAAQDRSRSRAGLLGTADEAGDARGSAPSAAKGYLDWKLDDRAGQPLVVRGFLLFQGPGQLAVGRPGSLQLRVPLLQSRQQLGVRLLQAGDLALKLFLVSGGTEARLPHACSPISSASRRSRRWVWCDLRSRSQVSKTVVFVGPAGRTAPRHPVLHSARGSMTVLQARRVPAPDYRTCGTRPRRSGMLVQGSGQLAVDARAASSSSARSSS